MKIVLRATAVIVLSGSLWWAAGCGQKAQEPATSAEKSAGDVAAEAKPEAAPAMGAAETAAHPGEELFIRHCAVCHPAGGNIINSQKTLSLEHREANSVNSVDAIVQLMRKPGPGMSVFDEQIVPDDKARVIAEYILESFK